MNEHPNPENAERCGWHIFTDDVGRPNSPRCVLPKGHGGFCSDNARLPQQDGGWHPWQNDDMEPRNAPYRRKVGDEMVMQSVTAEYVNAQAQRIRDAEQEYHALTDAAVSRRTADLRIRAETAEAENTRLRGEKAALEVYKALADELAMVLHLPKNEATLQGIGYEVERDWLARYDALTSEPKEGE